MYAAKHNALSLNEYQNFFLEILVILEMQTLKNYLETHDVKLVSCLCKAQIFKKF